MIVDWIVFVAGAALAIAGALGVIAVKNPVHSALLLVLTLFGVAVLFVSMEAHFLAVVQVIVYAGAIVVLFLFVIMLLGVDRTTDELRTETLKGQRPAAAILGIVALVELVLITRVNFMVGQQSVAGAIVTDQSNVEQLGRSVFTRYLFPFEITSVLLVIAVVGAVLLARKPKAALESTSQNSSESTGSGAKP
jgi:NADH-quinone oxidoreductase subunit J